MTDRVADLGSVSPLFVVSDVEESAACYQRSLGFELRALLPTDDPFFAIVGRGQAQICLKQISPDVPAFPNPSRHKWAQWDAFIWVDDPAGLESELLSRGVALRRGLHRREDDGLRGFEVAAADGYVLVFGRAA